MGIGKYAKIAGRAVAAYYTGGLSEQYFQGKEASKAQADIAKQQEALAREQLAIQTKMREEAIKLAAPSFNELSSVQGLISQRDQSLGLQRVALQRQYDTLAQVDEATKKQGEQVIALIDGQDNERTSQARKQVDQSRAKFEAQMADRLGSGWRTSSAGLEASMRFEDQATTSLLNAQQAAFQNYQGLLAGQGQAVANVSGAQTLGTQLNSDVINAEDFLKKRQIAAQTGTVPDYNNVINTAGSDQMGKILQARNISNTISTGQNMALTYFSGGTSQLAGKAGGGGASSANGGSGMQPTVGQTVNQPSGSKVSYGNLNADAYSMY